MSPEKSFFLHFARWTSALFVLIGHSQLIGGGGGEVFIFLSSHAHAAVMVFFVLSGYVIAATVDKKRKLGLTLKEYYVDRFSRIYSVLIPAIFLTIVIDSVGARLFDERYLNPALLPQDNYAIRLIINLLSLQGIWGYRVQFGSNPALWSIGYEFCYYILYGLIVWRPRYWFLFVFFIAIIVGPKVLTYGFIWLLGVLAFKMQSKISINIIAGFILLIGANYFFQYSLSGVMSAIHEIIRDIIFSIFVMMFVLSNPKIPSSKFLIKVNKEMAEFSYSSYAYHYPIMFFVYALLPSTPLISWGVVIFSLFFARILFEFTENKRFAIKRLILNW
jgi:peptidoglycan/LPS O-acetylase OafA/YrhL